MEPEKQPCLVHGPSARWPTRRSQGAARSLSWNSFSKEKKIAKSRQQEGGKVKVCDSKRRGLKSCEGWGGGRVVVDIYTWESRPLLVAVKSKPLGFPGSSDNGDAAHARVDPGTASGLGAWKG
ncbi:hypothetical protein ACLOJK_031813 [Asimina triloba]